MSLRHNYSDRNLHSFLFASLILFAFLASVSIPATAFAQAPAAGQIQTHIDAGQFPQAVALAQGIVDPAERDRLLGTIATAQAKSGATSGAMQTLSSIEDDRVRSYSLHDIAGTPLQQARGGGAQPDFQSLVDMVTTTIQPDTWDQVGGPGSVAPFPGGVYFDTKGLMKKVGTVPGELPPREPYRPKIYQSGNANVGEDATLRKVSLTRLEKLAQMYWAVGREPDDAMLSLGGMTEVKYLLLYPESGDIVLAGPAGPWKRDAEGRLVNAETGRPTLRLDDLVVLMRNAISTQGRFGCSITPTQENLARTKAFLAESAKKSLPPGAAARNRWLAELRDNMGQQTIEVHGVDPRTRVAKIIVEADYHMKLVGMGIEPGVEGVEDYIDRIVVPAGQAAPPLDVLRWWFTLNYEGIYATEDRTAFEFRGTGVQVLSENEMLTARGERVHTGKSDALNRAFARDFTKHFDALAERYPIYAELQNIADLALVAAVIEANGMASRVGWHRTHFCNGRAYNVALGVAPKTVETVIRHRMIGGGQIIAGVSGGVIIHTKPYLRQNMFTAVPSSPMRPAHVASAPKSKMPWNAWWWD